MDDPIPPAAYEDLVTAAETYRAALVVRLAGEIGLRTAEIPRVRPCDLRDSERVAGAAILSVPASDGEHDPGRERTDREEIGRETFVPASLSTELQRYADSVDLEDDEPFIDVSPRRIQMVVSETADRAATLSNDSSLSEITPRDLRQAFAQRLLDRGLDAHVVREAGGWGSLGALDPYLDSLDGEAIAEAVEGDGRGPTQPADDTDSATPRNGAHGSDPPTPDGWETLLDAFAAIPAVTDREALFETAVERVTTGDRWETAWVVRGATSGTNAGTDVAAVAGTVSGERSGSLPAVPEGDTGPWQVAITDGEPAVRRMAETGLAAENDRVAEDGLTAENDRVAEDGLTAENDRDAEDVDRTGPGSLLAVPIGHRDATYGALCLRSGEAGPVTSAEREALAVLGRCLGWGVTAGRWRDLLHSDAVTRVEFRTTAADAFLAGTSDALDCRIELESAVAVSETSLRCYLHASDIGPQALADAIEAAHGVSELRVIETREEGCTVSIRVSGGSLVRALTEHGATVRDAVAEGGEVHVVADLPDGTDVGPIADGLRGTYPDVRLVSKESITQSPHTESTLREGVTERLTDRQWATLSAAYHSGYFDWPRGSTAEEVADAMDVSSPTFHNHLRKAQRALLETLFEDDRDQ